MDNPMIYGLIAEITGEIGAITKSKRNLQQGFNYRGIDDVMNALNPLFAKHKVFCVPEVLDKFREERTTQKGGTLLYSTLTIRYTFFAPDGSNVAAVVVGEGMDSGDKATNKAMAVAMKYAMFQVFCIPTEEMTDPDAETPPPSVPKEQTKEAQKPVAPVQPTQQPVTRKSMIDAAMHELGIEKEQFDAVALRLRGKGNYVDKDIYAEKRGENPMNRDEMVAALNDIKADYKRLMKG